MTPSAVPIPQHHATPVPADGSFVRLHLDANLLAAYESPSFDEANAVPLDALTSSQSPPFPPARKYRVIAPHDTTVSSILADYDEADSAGLMLSMLRAPSNDMRCRYRKGKCSNMRTLKKNGSLHTYCEFHRQRSIVNQRRFDRKKRATRDQCECVQAEVQDCVVPAVKPHNVPSDDASPIKSENSSPTLETASAWV